MLDNDLLAAARNKREAGRKQVDEHRRALEDAEDEFRATDEAVDMLERLEREHGDFNTAASAS